MTNLSVIIPTISALFLLIILVLKRVEQGGSRGVRIPVRIEPETTPRKK